MYNKNLVFWCCALLLFVSSSEPVRNFNCDNKQYDNSTVKYKLHANSMRKRSNEREIVQNDLSEDSSQDNVIAQNVLRTIRNSKNADNVTYPEKINETLHGISNIDDNETQIDSYGECDNITWINLCCRLGD